MMALGQFVFGLATLAPQDTERDTGWRYAGNSRVGARPSSQFLGPDRDTRSLSGILFPELVGDADGLDQLRAMGDTGQAFPLVDGVGRVLGSWRIDRIRDRRAEFHADGEARRIDFSIELTRVDDDGAGDQAGGDGEDGYFFDDAFNAELVEA